MSRRLVVVSGGLSDPSSTRLLADRLGEAAADTLRSRGVEVDVRTVELRAVAHEITNAMLTGFAADELADAQAALAAADGVVAVTPVFSASYSGLFKSFFDVLDRDALSRTPVLLGATAGTGRHSLVLDHALRPLFGYLRASVVPTAVFAASDDWGNDADLGPRIERAGAELADAVLARPEKGDPVAFGDDLPDFETLLRG
ncbi:oxidoreductase [Marmoricola endophyticus]|uniref:Oxidoreductase n=1 Tax=Marmoricola endophyticus TaxID=2040280 RepID=A0A917BJS4_9ACTN|nr:CE1759 family FMN reductase [Marmoricola endophyticus]GGF48396.1 oxidoreductase [Marmoricola endophyticus]